MASVEVVDFFLDPKSYPHAVERVEHVQTHISHLFFAGDYVYKLKKPVDLGFLDFSTLDKRRATCIAELELNRRLAPEIYLDVAALHRDEKGALSFTAASPVEEVAVVMKRLPANRRLARLIDAGEARPDVAAVLGRLLAHFHRNAETSREISRFGSLETIRRNWIENFEGAAPYLGLTISVEDFETVRHAVDRFMRIHEEMFAARVAGGWMRDCHGDLLTDDIYIDAVTGAAHVLDCIEFNARFRYSDTLADIAFLTMDLRQRGARSLAADFLLAYYENSDDAPLPALLRFYEIYRAFVRGKVKSFVVDEGEPTTSEKKAAAADARRFFSYAASEARALQPKLIIVAGMMGSGKTTLADALARETGLQVAHSDVLRKQLAGLAPTEAATVRYGEGIYSPAFTARTYAALLEPARVALRRGESFILDATWSSPDARLGARRLAAEYEAFFTIVECVAPEATLRERLSTPRAVSDGRLELFDPHVAAYRPPGEDEADLVMRVETTGDAVELAREAWAALSPPESEPWSDS